MFKKPSITICPAKVPVKVEFWPDAKSATAKTILAKLVPKIGANILWASWMSAISWLPVEWNVAAATIRIAALMKNAKNNENVLSIVANLMASFFPSVVLA